MGQEGEITSWLETESGASISIRGHCTFGRSSSNTVVLSKPKASRRHALIHEQGGEFWLVDLGSTNGIEINQQRVTHPVRLQVGDRIEMASTYFILRQAVEATGGAGLARRHELTPYDLTLPEIRTIKSWLLLADLQGFTVLSQQLPAEQLAPLVGGWMAECQDIIQKQNGILAKFLGDGFLAYWVASEDAPGIIGATCREFQAMQRAAKLPFRIVLHYGTISCGGGTSDAMIGPELNFAFRLEKVASQLKLASIFSESAAHALKGHLPLVSSGVHKVPDFEPQREIFTLA